MTTTITEADFSTVTMADLRTTYNNAADELGMTSVKKFADRETAVRRVTQIMKQLEEQQRTAKLPEDASSGVVAPPVERLQAAVREAIDAPPPVTTPAVAAAPAPKPEAWRKPKHLNASKVAYRPRADSVQARQYALLTQEGGITLEAFCAAGPSTGTKDKSFLSPAGVWSGLNYLFVSLKGYGLDFDGTHIRLLVPGDEREQPAKKGG